MIISLMVRNMNGSRLWMVFLSLRHELSDRRNILFLLIVAGRPHSFRTLWTPGHRVTAVNLTERGNSAGWLIAISPLTMNQQLDVAAR